MVHILSYLKCALRLLRLKTGCLPLIKGNISVIEIISESLLFPLDGGFNVMPLKSVSWQNSSLSIRIPSNIESTGDY
jgi:hypothetical protein